MFESHWINLQAPAQQETAWFQSSSSPESSPPRIGTTTDFEGQRCPQATGYSRGRVAPNQPALSGMPRGAILHWYQNSEQVLPRARFSAELLCILVPRVADPDEKKYL